MPFTPAALNAMLNDHALRAIWTSLHTADPGNTGAFELSGGSPAYARKAITWNAAASANLDNLANPVFDVPAGVTISYVGFWNALNGGTLQSYTTIPSETFTAQGTYTLADADHALV